MKPERIQLTFADLATVDLDTLDAVLEGVRETQDDLAGLLEEVWCVAKATPTFADDRIAEWIAERARRFGVEVKEPPAPNSMWDALADLFYSLSRLERPS